ncbi:hypothetical protein HDV02_001592, partial [Globomyces sp. JEL0801]
MSLLAKSIRALRPALARSARPFASSSLLREGFQGQIPDLHTLTEVTKFSTEVLAPRVRDQDENELADPEIIKALFDNGLMGLEVAADLGGAEASFMSAILTIEEMSKVDPSIAVICDVHNTLVNTMLKDYGTQEQKEKYLAPLATSKVPILFINSQLGSFCLSEAGSGSDAFALKSRATKDGNKWILNGSKMWITNSYEAETFLIFANVDPSKGYKGIAHNFLILGITCFIVEKDMGVKIAKKEKKLGIRSSSTCVISFDDIEVPEENVLGEIGQGYKYAIRILNEGRIGIAAQMIGLAQGAVDSALPYTFQRKQF